MTIATGVDPAFSQFYVAKEAGLFEKNGLDVTINTGPSGSAMVPFLINNQVQAAYGSDLAGVINHQVDNNIVAVADGTYLRQVAVGGRPQRARPGRASRARGSAIAKGTGSEIFWNRVVEKLKLKAADYKIVDVEAPEMLAAIERGDIDGFAVWEPWPTRTLMTVKGTKILQTAEGIYNNINFVYMNRSWIEKNEDTAEKFIRALVAGQRPHREGPAGGAAMVVAKFLKMPIELARELMPKVEFDMTLTDRADRHRSRSPRSSFAEQKKLKAPLDYSQVRLHRPAQEGAARRT